MTEGYFQGEFAAKCVESMLTSSLVIDSASIMGIGCFIPKCYFVTYDFNLYDAISTYLQGKHHPSCNQSKQATPDESVGCEHSGIEEFARWIYLGIS